MSDPDHTEAAKWRARVREKLLDAIVLGIPLIVLGKVNDALSTRLLSQPWQAVWFLVPIGIAVWLLRRGVVRRTQFTSKPDRRLLAFLGVYILLFTIASRSSVLDLSRQLTAFGTPASQRWLTPVSWGDWRYRLVPRNADPRQDLVIVLLKPSAGRSTLETRKEIIDLVALASRGGATGVALDVYFNTPSAIDPLLCRVVDSARFPVFVGFGFTREGSTIVEEGIPNTLKPCFPPERIVHLAGFRDFDVVSRVTPLFFRNDFNRPALGLAVARSLGGGTHIDMPADHLLRFVAPLEDPPTRHVEDLQASASATNVLRNRFVMVGEEEQDAFNTAFGRKPGIVIHSYVVHSLRQAHYIQRFSSWLGVTVLLVFCYWLTMWCADGVPFLKLVLVCVGATVVIIAIAISSILVGPYWFDVIYPVTAVWLLLPILVSMRRSLPAAVFSPVNNRGRTVEEASQPRK